MKKLMKVYIYALINFNYYGTIFWIAILAYILYLLRRTKNPGSQYPPLFMFLFRMGSTFKP